jgi:DNA-directed RNA polymerase subunit E'/Rpb7
MESEAFFEQRIIINPRDLNSIDNTSINSIIIDRLRESLENKCSKHGFVIPNTLEILSRSLGRVENGRFTGSFVYQVQARGKVLVPVDGTIIKGVILKKNKMGIYVYYRNAFRIMIPRDFHLGDQVYEGLNIGDEIEVQLKKSRFQVRDPYIISVGLLVKSVPTMDIIDDVEEEVANASAEGTESASEPGSPTKTVRKNTRRPPMMTPIKEESNSILEDIMSQTEPSADAVEVNSV